MNRTINLRRLQDYFAPADIEWKPLRYTKDRTRAMAAPYITNRAIMDRLDAVCGPENWRNEFERGPDGGVLCGVSIRIGREWLTKWDGASNTEIEAVKGGLSNSMRRAAVQWGIGRYLYRLPARWQAVDGKGRFTKTPLLPPSLYPAYVDSDGGERPSSLRPLTAKGVQGREGTTARRPEGPRRIPAAARTNGKAPRSDGAAGRDAASADTGHRLAPTG